MRWRRSTSCSLGMLIWNSRMSSFAVAACACMGIKLEAAAADMSAEAARILRRSGDGNFADIDHLYISGRDPARSEEGLISICTCAQTPQQRNGITAARRLVRASL